MEAKPFLEILKTLGPYARKLVGMFHLRVDHEDLLQDAAIALHKFCKRHKKLKRGESDAVYRAFVKRVLESCAQTQLRKQKNHERNQSLVVEPQDHRSAGGDSDLRTILNVLAKAQHELGLSGEFTLAVILEDSTPADLAETWGISPSAGKKRFTRGIRILRRVLERHLDCGLTRAVDPGDSIAS